MDTYLVLTLSLLALLSRALISAYFFLAPHELKRRSSRGKEIFKRLYMVVQYGASGRQLLQFLTAVFVVAAITMVSQNKTFLYAFVFGLGLILVLVLIGSLRLRSAVRVAAWLAPYFAPIVGYFDSSKHTLKRFLAKIQRKKNQEPDVVTDLYVREDLENLLSLQKRALNNRIDVDELDRALKALEFSGQHIKAHMQPRKKVRFVTAKEPIGPILLSELHKTGQTVFPVKGNSRHEILGMLELDALNDHAEGGTVADAMTKAAYFVREDQVLNCVLQAFNKTHTDSFIVVNIREQVVGMISVTTVLEVLLGTSLETDFEQFNEIAAVSHIDT